MHAPLRRSGKIALGATRSLPPALNAETGIVRIGIGRGDIIACLQEQRERWGFASGRRATIKAWMAANQLFHCGVRKSQNLANL